MKNKGKIRILTALFAVVLCMAAFPLSAYAGGGEDETEPPAETATEQDAATINPVALTPDGNMTLVDDIEGEQAEDKQFITVVTKNGNYFYIIIDRADDGENNVHFLNLVDESDLLALLEELGETTQPTTVTPAPEPTITPEPAETEPEPEAEETGGGMGGILLIVIVLAVGGGAAYYFKIFKPKQTVKGGTDLSELDELDFDDDGYFNTGNTGADGDSDEQEDGTE